MNQMATVATMANGGEHNLHNFYANLDCRQPAKDSTVERCVIMYKDENGYGLTVGGDNPVLVESVKPGGGASKAGIRPGDKILKINGTCVLDYSHMDVVQIISTSSDHIALTLSGSPVKRYFRSSRSERQLPQTAPVTNSYTVPGPSNGRFPYPNGAQLTKRASLATILDHNANLKHQITSPKPVTKEKQAECDQNRQLVLQQMYEEELINVQQLERKLTNLKPPISTTISKEIEDLLKQSKFRLNHLADQLDENFSTNSIFNFNDIRMDKSNVNNQDPTNSTISPDSSSKSVQRKPSSKCKKSPVPQTTSASAPSTKIFSKSFDCPSTILEDSPKLKNLVQNSPNRSLSPNSYISNRSAEKVENSTAKFGSKFLNKSSSEKVGKKEAQQKQQQPGVSTSSTFPGDYHFVATAQVSVMDESDSDTEAVVPLDMEGPFSNFAELKNRPAHLAVFLHYLLSNSDPSSLLFFIISDLYSLINNSKDSRRWAYEIHSTFLTPTAPLKIATIDMPIVQEIDTILLSIGEKSSQSGNDAIFEQQNDENLKKIFVKARQKALDEINDLLADFRNKRMLGLGNVYGESRLNGLTPGDQNRERKIIDSLLSQHFESFFNGKTDFDQLSDRQQALAISLATILKHQNVKPNNMYHEKLLDKCPIFVAKEKKSFNLLTKPSKKPAQVKGHCLLLTSLFSTTVCSHCQEVIWGVNPQAYFCSNCDCALHKTCVTSFDDPCSSGGGCRSGKRNAPDALRKAVMATAAAALAKSAIGAGPPPSIFRSSDEEETTQTQPKSCFLAADAAAPAAAPLWTSTSCSADSGYGGDVGQGAEKTLAANVARSQSMKSHQEEQRSLKRNGDPGGRRTKSDVDSDDKSIVLATMGSDQQLVAGDLSSSAASSSSALSPPSSPTSNNSSLLTSKKKPLISSASFTAASNAPPLQPTTSLQSASTTTTLDSSSSTLTPGACGMSASWTSASTLTSATTMISRQAIDSDLEVDNEIPHLEDYLHWETVKTLKPKERKRQEVVNELFHTERTHARNLKILYYIFYEPLLNSNVVPLDTVHLIFSNLDELLDMHSRLNSAMKLCVKKSKLIGDIGTMLLGFFDGSSGEKFKNVVSTFCQNQQHALEILKLKQKKDPKFLQFLQEAESSPICRKLQLKDMLPMEMQRLTKYPLLLETIAKYTPEPSPESENVKRCVWLAKQILDGVNTAKRNFENERRVDELQRRLDTRDFDRLVQQHPNENNLMYKNMDLRKKSLVHDGPLTWRLNKNKAVDLHVVLVEDLLILLSKNSDGHRLCLKYHNVNLTTAGKDDLKFTHCPLLRLNSIIAKSVATDKKAFFIVSTPTTPQGPQIYELVAQTASDKKNWFKLITEQIESCKQRESQEQQQSAAASALASPAAASNDGGAAAAATPEAEKIADASVLSSPGGRDDRSKSLEGANGDPFQVEHIRIISQPRLINPDEVLVCQPTVLEHAEPVLTPFEQLKRRDDTIVKSLAEKQRILMEMCGWPEDQMSARLSEILGDVWSAPGAAPNGASGQRTTKDAKEMALAAVVQTNRIIEAINNVMRPKDQDPENNPCPAPSTSSPSVPCSQLTLIVAPLMKYLTGLLPGLQAMEDDLRRVREELRRCQTAEQRDESPVVTPNGDAPADEERRREKLKQKRQRNAALVGKDDCDSLKNE